MKKSRMPLLHRCRIFATPTPCRRYLALGAIAISWLAVLATTRPIAAQVKQGVLAAPAASSASLTDKADSADAFLKDGEVHEKAHQWGDALSVYQQAIKLHPTNQKLRQRRAVARIHFDFDRRYSDSSFLSSVDSTDHATALSTYAEVLAKIQTHYVDEPNWAELASYGLTSLEIALMSEPFRTRHIPQATEQQIRETILATREKLSTEIVNTPQDATRIVQQTAQWMQASLSLKPQVTFYEFVCGAISALDPYSAFMSKNQFNETMSQIEGNFVGLGVELRTHPDHLEIVSVIPDGSAALGGIVKGDKIVAVNGQNVAMVGGEKAADLLRGPEESIVEIVVNRDDRDNTLRLKRLRVEIPSIDAVELVDPEKGIGYIRLTNFQKTTPRDFDQALWQLHRQGMQSLIVDLRGNPGGLLKASVDVADRFINSGIIVSTRGRNPMEDFVHRASPALTWQIPLVVLVDENSASASEIFAAAIRDHGRGTIVGQTTYGKGSVQGIFPLSASGGVRLTTAKFYSPLGKPISEVGVPADRALQVSTKFDPEVSIGEDHGLRIGIETARQELQHPQQAIAGARSRTVPYQNPANRFSAN
jgi:carboxyl-terminal processing protease